MKLSEQEIEAMAVEYAIKRGADRDKYAFRSITNRDLYDHTVECFEAGFQQAQSLNGCKSTPLTKKLLEIGLSFETKNNVECINVNWYIYLVWAENHLVISHHDGKKFIDLKLQRIYTFEHLEKWLELSVATTEYQLGVLPPPPTH